MAQRLQGRFSPGARPGADGSPPTPPAPPPAPKPVGLWRTTGLFLSSFAFLFPAFGDAPQAMLMGLAAGGLLVLSAWSTREGIRAQAEYDARRTARRPALPRKILGAALTGVALALGGLIAWPAAIATALAVGVMGAGLHVLTFGLDPLADKGMEGVDAFQTDRVARAVAEAETHLAAMKDAILRAGDRALEARVDRFATAARALFRTVESDPGDLTAARKYLSVYLMGARDATVSFADLYARTRDAKARADYEALLTDLETNFAERTRTLLSGSRSSLDVEIAVLRDRLKMEG